MKDTEKWRTMKDETLEISKTVKCFMKKKQALGHCDWKKPHSAKIMADKFNYNNFMILLTLKETKRK